MRGTKTNLTTHQIINPQVETAILVGVQVRGSVPLLPLQDSLRELDMLAQTAGIEVQDQITQTLNHIDPSTFIGSGKVQEIKARIEELGVQTVIFDDELSPRHQRELEKVLGQEIKLLDRSALILDIFAQHAHTREGVLQVELAQYEYRLPRLTRAWTHLARQAGGSAGGATSGGVGVRGPGETQLEVDKREINRKITKLRADLENVRAHRQRYRAKRKRDGLPVIALVGYTNAGKSTLLNALSGAKVYTANQLFATLDPTTRRVELPSSRQVLFTDTVGFIQKLPTALIAAFRATLEEIGEANMLLHVVDASHPNVGGHIEAVEDTLAELEVPDMPRLLVWNKCDQWPHEHLPRTEEAELYDAQVRVSAKTGEGIDHLLQAIEDTFASRLIRATLCIPYQRGDIVSRLFEVGRVEDQQHTGDGVVLTVEMPLYWYRNYQMYEV